MKFLQLQDYLIETSSLEHISVEDSFTLLLHLKNGSIIPFILDSRLSFSKETAMYAAKLISLAFINPEDFPFLDSQVNRKLYNQFPPNSHNDLPPITLVFNKREVKVKEKDILSFHYDNDEGYVFSITTENSITDLFIKPTISKRSNLLSKSVLQDISYIVRISDPTKPRTIDIQTLENKYNN